MWKKPWFYWLIWENSFNFRPMFSLLRSDSPIKKLQILAFSRINFMSACACIPLSQINGLLWDFSILDKFTEVFKETFKVFKFLLFIPIIEFSKDKASSASLSEWTSTNVEMFKSLAAW